MGQRRTVFYLGDTAWELFHALNREETECYFAERKRQGFTAVQAVALAEMEGVTTPNAYGRLPLCMTNGLPDPERPDTAGDYSYWDHVDFGVETAAKGKDYAYVYSPLGVPFTVDLSVFAGTKCVKGLWFDPRTGEETAIGIFRPGEKTLVVPPSRGKGQDWVLVLEAVAG